MRAIDLVGNVSDLLGWGEVKTIEGEVSKEVRTMVRGCELVLHSMQGDKNWAELTKEGTLVTQEEQSLGAVTMAATKGSSTITGNFFSADALDITGCLMQVEGYDTVYRIIYIDDQTMKLDREWIDDDYSALSAVMTIARDRYEVPDDYDRMRSTQLYDITGGDAYVDIVEEDDVGMVMGASMTPDDPTKVFIGGLSPKGKQMLTFDNPPKDKKLYRYKYQRLHPKLELDATPILYPVRYHQAIIDLVVARLSRDIDNKVQAQAQAGEALQEKIKQHSNPSTSETRMRLTPGGRRARIRRRY